jgi:uncharacterized LabA/DUF88 family protein
MKDRYVVLVDAGYLLASAGALVHGVANRRDLRFDAPGLVSAVRTEAAERIDGELLRMYWYDAARDRVPTVEHRAVASLPAVKVRLGNLNRQGQQKGVDALLRSDLETLASNGAITRAALLAGDEDMLPAVEAAQSYGVEVHLWAVEPPYGRNQAERLVWEADGVHEIGRELLAPHVEVVVRPPAAVPAQPAEPQPVPAVPAPHPTPALLAGLRRAPVPAPTGPDPAVASEVGEHIAGKWLVTRGRENLADLLPGPALPTVIDRELLVAGEEELGRSLRPWPDARRALRDGFWERLYREFGLRV